jgi:hypothetical protein
MSIFAQVATRAIASTILNRRTHLHERSSAIDVFFGHGNPMNADYDHLGPDAQSAIPTPEHFLPLLYVLGTRQPGDLLSFPVSGFDGGSISMLCMQVG